MNYILGSILGAFYGDASGGTLEFYGGPFSKEEAINAMNLPGKGKLWLGEGQVTDDSELAMCLATGLLNYPDMDYVAYRYQQWYLSDTIDVGITIWSILKEIKDEPREGLGKKMEEIAIRRSPGSKSNGALMRSTPIPIFGTIKKLSLDEIYHLAIKDAKLTHSNPIVQEINGLYCIAIATLLQNPRNIDLVIENVKKYMKDEEITSWFKKATISRFTFSNSDIEKLSKEMDKLSEFREKSGYIKHSFILAFSLLVNKIPYKDAICSTIMLGGDTDTNSSIVGGLLGAYWGYDELPKEMIKKMLEYIFVENEDQLGSERPEWLHITNIYNIIKKYELS